MTQTRLKLVIGMVILALLEGLLRVWLKDFPIIEVFSVQTTALGAYLAAKTVSGINYDNNVSNTMAEKVENQD